MKAKLNWGEPKAHDRIGTNPRTQHSLFYPACPLCIAWICLWHRHCGKTAVWNWNLLFATCQKAKPKLAGTGTASSLVLHPQVPQEPLCDGLSEGQGSLLSPCSGNFHCGTQLLIKGNHPAISPSQVWRCSSPPGHRAQQPFPANKKPTGWKTWIKHNPCKAIKKSPYHKLKQ